jgi:hypothetical protein
MELGEQSAAPAGMAQVALGTPGEERCFELAPAISRVARSPDRRGGNCAVSRGNVEARWPTAAHVLVNYEHAR